MVNFESLPRLIEVVGTPDWYNLDVHITAWNKICVSYRLLDKWALENNEKYFIFSNVVEPDMRGEINNDSENMREIIDVPSFELALAVLSARVNKAIENGVIKVRH